MKGWRKVAVVGAVVAGSVIEPAILAGDSGERLLWIVLAAISGNAIEHWSRRGGGEGGR